MKSTKVDQAYANFIRHEIMLHSVPEAFKSRQKSQITVFLDFSSKYVKINESKDSKAQLRPKSNHTPSINAYLDYFAAAKTCLKNERTLKSHISRESFVSEAEKAQILLWHAVEGHGSLARGSREANKKQLANSSLRMA